MGYAGQLSLGHALYVGLGGYVAAALWVHFGIGPWLGVFPAVAVAAAFGAAIGWLGFRFGIEGVYFALLTIAFAEFTRIGFDHIAFTGGAGGLFLPYEEKRLGEWWNLRGGQHFFYYLALRARVCRRAAHRAAFARPARLPVARDPRGRDRRAGARHRRVPRQDEGCADFLRHDRGGRGVLRVLQQQPVPGAGVRYRAGRSSSFWRRSSAGSARFSAR